MARLRSNHVITLSEDSTELEVDYERPETDDEITDDYAKSATFRTTIAASGSYAVPFGSITNGQLLIVESDQDVTVAINGGTPLHVTPRQNAAVIPQTSPATYLRGRWFLETDGLTSLTVANPSSTTAAKVTVVLGGA